MMGSGGLIVMDEDNCMVDIAQILPGLHRGRVLRQVHPLPHRHQAHAGDSGAHRRRQGRGWATSRSWRSWPITSRRPRCAAWARRRPTRCCPPSQYFRDEYEAHIKEKRCPAGVTARSCCTTRSIPTSAAAARLCARSCPVDAITGTVKEPHRIDTRQVHQVRRLHGEVQVRRDRQELMSKEEEQTWNR